MANRNPKGSKIPVVGIIPQIYGTSTGIFMDKLEEDIKTFKGNLNEILDNYYKKNITHMVSDYSELNDYLTTGIKYVNYVDKQTASRNKILEALENSRTKCYDKNLKCQNRLKEVSAKYNKTFNKIIQQQKDKQIKRTTKKVVIKLVSLGNV